MEDSVIMKVQRARLKFWRIVLTTKFVAAKYPFMKPYLMILSFPRSGSTWIGGILSTSEDVAFLNEPITRAYLDAEGELSLVDIECDEIAYHSYKILADRTFAGEPIPIPYVILDVRPFSIFGRNRRRLVLKEVNPKAVKFYSNHYNPDFLLILRHPAAVALSFGQLGWLHSPDVLRVIDMSQTERTSENEARKWKRDLAQEEIFAIRKGYQLSGLDIYSSDQDWSN